MKKFFLSIALGATCLIFSCNGHGSGNKKNNDSSYSGLEGTQEEAATHSGTGSTPIDTSSGQTSKKSPVKDSSRHGKDSLSIK